jgi:hypothetical protein
LIQDESARAPAVETGPQPVGERLYDLIGYIREFEAWALENEQLEAWTRLCHGAGVTHAQNLKSYGIAKLRPLVDAIKAWRRERESPIPAAALPIASTATTATTPGPVAGHPPSPGFHAQAWALRGSLSNDAYHKLIVQHGGAPGIINFGLSPEKQQALLADLRGQTQNQES